MVEHTPAELGTTQQSETDTDASDEIPFDEGDTVTVNDSYEADVVGITPYSGRVTIEAERAEARGSRTRATRDVFVEMCEPVSEQGAS